MAYNKEAQKKYNGKSNYIQLKYTPNQMAEYDRIKQYHIDNKLTLQGYIKGLIQRDLDRKNIPYISDVPTQHDDI